MVRDTLSLLDFKRPQHFGQSAAPNSRVLANDRPETPRFTILCPAELFSMLSLGWIDVS